jgi:hypothetical protein
LCISMKFYGAPTQEAVLNRRNKHRYFHVEDALPQS